MYLELKSLEALRAAELPQVAAPGYAISWLKNAQSGFCQVRGFNNAWEACIHELDPRRDHWNHRVHGFDILCERIRNGEMVAIFAPSWPPTSPAYAKVNGQWEPTQHMHEPRDRQRLETRVKALQYEQREAEILQSQNRPSTAVVLTEPAGGPGTRAATLGPHVGQTPMGPGPQLSPRATASENRPELEAIANDPAIRQEIEKTWPIESVWSRRIEARARFLGCT